ncbi:hypothetical protein AYO40_03195 [Planctomycetaceae bacterium SCGC AG-212-D15]|nr:hypothetical protein AYO40_03195 [Planctomycetaceae bacterium SCGC AG-212-D15]
MSTFTNRVKQHVVRAFSQAKRIDDLKISAKESNQGVCFWLCAQWMADHRRVMGDRSPKARCGKLEEEGTFRKLCGFQEQKLKGLQDKLVITSGQELEMAWLKEEYRIAEAKYVDKVFAKHSRSIDPSGMWDNVHYYVRESDSGQALLKSVASEGRYHVIFLESGLPNHTICCYTEKSKIIVFDPNIGEMNVSIPVPIIAPRREQGFFSRLCCCFSCCFGGPAVENDDEKGPLLRPPRTLQDEFADFFTDLIMSYWEQSDEGKIGKQRYRWDSFYGWTVRF